MKIEQTNTPQSDDIDFLTQKINAETPQFGQASPFAFFIRDDHESIIAGCNGSIIFGVIYTDQLWVAEDYRGQGLGRKLMNKVNHYARELNCTMATVNTMDFQNARAFYEGLGYECDFARSGYAADSSMIFLKRSL